MKKTLLCLLLIPVLSFGIEPIIISLNDQMPSYTVPAGKVLLIEHLEASFFDPDSEAHGQPLNLDTIRLTFTSGDNVHRWAFFKSNYYAGLVNSQSFSRPLKIPETTLIQFQQTRTDGYPAQIDIFGLLVASADLYAGIETQSEGMLCQNGAFSFDVLASSARPSVIKLEGSSDLSEWHPISGGEIAKLNSNTRSVSVPVGGNQRYFVKTALTSVTQ